MIKKNKDTEHLVTPGSTPAENPSPAPNLYKMIGRIQMGNYFSQIGTITNLIFLKQVKDTKIYKDLPDIRTWEAFCKLTGRTARYIDEQLKNLETFGAEFLELSAQIGVSPTDYRKLRKLPESEIRRLTDGTEVDLSDQLALKDLIEDLIADKYTAQNALAAGKEESIKKLGRLADENHKLKSDIKKLQTAIDIPEKYLQAFERADDHIMAALKIITSLPDKLIKEDLHTQSKISAALTSLQKMIDNQTMRIAELSLVDE
jgi:hypothetical protein